MVGPDVEGLEVVPVGLHLGALDHAVSHPGEDVDDLVLDDRERVQRSGPQSMAGQRHVDGVGVEEGVLGSRLERIAALLVDGVERGLDLVDAPAHLAPIIDRQRAERSLDLRPR